MNVFALICTLIPINRGLPIPESRNPATRKYPFKDMSVGDSFFVPGKTRQNMAGSIRYASCECRKFASRRVVENGVAGLRVWRVA